LNRLIANRSLREWLEWPTNRFAGLPQGALFFACKRTDWARQQLLYAVLLGINSIEGTRLIVHGFPWKMFDRNDTLDRQRMIISNGPLMVNTTPILAQCGAQSARVLSEQFLQGHIHFTENLQLLHQGEAIAIADGLGLFITWSPRVF
ncbi:MAG: hypothetical protein GY805_06590, partial [Chloroflexi bacterium]|nr:hypothetical protein [Chloroflexota bacterium]